MGHITASADSLMEQASWTASTYLNNAIAEIDKALGKGFASKHPELIAAFMKVAASDMNFATLAKAHSEAIEALGEAVRELADKSGN